MQVILVGHDFGGACVSYAMELFPFKIAKAVFVSAAMLTNGQSTLDMFTQQVCIAWIIILISEYFYLQMHTNYAGLEKCTSIWSVCS